MFFKRKSPEPPKADQDAEVREMIARLSKDQTHVGKIIGIRLVSGEEIIGRLCTPLMHLVVNVAGPALIDKPMVVIRNFSTDSARNFLIIQPWCSVSANTTIPILSDNVLTYYFTSPQTAQKHEELWNTYTEGHANMFNEEIEGERPDTPRGTIH